MNTADYFVIALIFVPAVVGLLRGFLREVIALLTWIFALVIAWHFGPLIEPKLGGLLAEPHVRPWAARALVWLAVMLVGAATSTIVCHFVRLAMFSAMDRFLGFVFGIVRGLVILGVCVLVCQTLRLDGERWWHRSMLLPYAEQVAGVLRSMLGEDSHQRRQLTVFNFVEH
jgi:membrane protein required for colicin V production